MRGPCPSTDKVCIKTFSVDRNRSANLTARPTMSKQAAAQQDLGTQTVDLLVIGAGAAGMAAALFAKLKGLDVLLIEKSNKIGGTAATSAGTLWIPATPKARRPVTRIAFLKPLSISIVSSPVTHPAPDVSAPPILPRAWRQSITCKLTPRLSSCPAVSIRTIAVNLAPRSEVARLYQRHLTVASSGRILSACGRRFRSS